MDDSELDYISQTDYELQNMSSTEAGRRRESFHREILLSFWKVHILHHAAEHPVVGQWMLEELRHHGYTVSSGTLYPVLKRMEARGWLRSRVDPAGGPRARREYHLTREGRRVRAIAKRFLKELTGEVKPDADRKYRPRR
jgi:DNA-binding PadR family transcriptional regulator